MASDRVELRVLGPLQVLVGGRQLVLTSPSQRALLAALLLRANQAVATVRLIDDLWAQTPPARADVALRMAVSRLRRVLATAGQAGSEMLVTRPGGYVLQVDPERLDVHRFERLAGEGHQALAAGRAELAAERLRAALGLWRGPLLADVDPMAVAVAEANRLEQVRLAALQARIDVDQALGRHAQALVDLQALVTDHPLDEGAAARLMRALAYAGRQADALAVYRQLRRRLVEELGIEPSPPLQQLEQAILTGEAALQPSTPSAGSPTGTAAAGGPPAELPPAVAGFTGRDQELERLDRALASAGQPGQTVICAIQGPGGVGKSALAIQAAHRNAHRFPDGQLYVNLQGATPGLAPLAPLEILGRFLRSLGMDPAQVPTDLQEAAGRFRSLVEGRHLLVVLDNAHNTTQIRPLLPGSPTCAALTTSRQTLTGLQSAVPMHLGVFSQVEAVELLGRIGGRQRLNAEPEAAAEVVEYCGRLPLAIQIAAARLAARPAWPVSELARRLADTTSRLDELELADIDIRASFQVSVHALQHSPDPTDQAAATAFGLLALPDGPDLGLPAAARLLDQPERTTSTQLERLVDAQLLETPRPGRYQFHDLLRLFAREHATQHVPQPQRLAALTRLLTFYTATAWQTLALLRPGDHRLATANPDWTTNPLPFPDQQAALAWLQTERANLLAAIDRTTQTAPAIPAELASQLTMALLGFFTVHGLWSDGLKANHIALSLARRTGDRTAQAYAQHDLGSFSWRLGRHDEAIASLRESLAGFRELGDRHGEASSLSNLGLVYWRLGCYDQAVANLQESLAAFRELGDRRGESSGLGNLGMVYERLGRYRETLESQRESLAIDRELGDRHGEAAGLGNLGRAYWRLGRDQEAIDCQRQSLAIFQELGDRWGQAACLNDLGTVYRRLGRHQEALDCQRQSLAIFQELGDRYGQAEALRDLGDALVSVGRWQRARLAWREALVIFEALQVPETDDLRARLATTPPGSDPAAGAQ
ncbi:MAG TPA: BTAD domain-containing putative transcriptional regulator [Actinomycetes bacterium]|nr:BTAD domain-containing putative transcriptional regulator [Actinomycetes bacterium]